MYAAQKFENGVLSRAKGKVVGFDFSIILTALIPLLMDAISSCFGKLNSNEITTKLVNGKEDWWITKQVELAIRKELKASGQKMSGEDQRSLRDSVLEEWSVDPAQTQQMVNEMKAIQDFGML